MTAQEIFDRVWRHFVTEGNPRSVNPDDGSCYYRSASGARCAVGVLIPDAEYSEEFDANPSGTSVGRLLWSSMCPPSLLALRAHEDLLQELQCAHDEHREGEMAGALRAVAEDFDLTVPS